MSLKTRILEIHHYLFSLESVNFEIWDSVNISYADQMIQLDESYDEAATSHIILLKL